MTDNFKQLKRLMDFSDEEKFYYLQILARSKDGNDKATKVVKNYYITNEEYLDEREQQIKDLCNFFNARAYLRLNRRSYEQVAYKTLQKLAKTMEYGQFEFARKAYSKAAGGCNKEENKIWIVDFDGEDFYDSNEFLAAFTSAQNYIEELQSEIQKDYKILDDVQTPNGVHLLTNPFNVQKFKEVFPMLDIKKDNPTILYANV